MHSIQAPIKPGESGSRVANVQDALRLFLERGVVRSLDPPDSPTAEELHELGRLLAEERAESTYGKATRRLVQIVQLQQGLGDNLDGVVEDTTATLLTRLLERLGAFDDKGSAQLVVKGRVSHVGGAPAAGFIVRARDRDLRTFQALGHETVTNDAGRYEIRYAPGGFARAEAEGPDLVVRVFAAGTDRDPDQALAESPTVFNAPPVAEVDVEIPEVGDSRPSEFERHVEVIKRLLVGQGQDGGDLPLFELTDLDVDFLSGDTDIAREHVAWLAQAFAFAHDGHVPAALFYGWFREGQPDDREELANQSIGALRAAALAAIADEIIPAELESSLEQSLDAMPSPQRNSLQASVTLAGVGKKAVREILMRAGTATELTDPVVNELVGEGEISTADAHRVGLALATHDLAGGDESVMAAVLGAKPAPLEGKGLRRAHDLARLDARELERALDEANVTPPAGRTLSEYAGELAEEIAERFPTEALLNRVTTIPDDIGACLERAVRSGDDSRSTSGDVNGGPTEPDALRQFVNLHPGLKLDEVIEEADDTDAALATIKKRVGWVEQVRELNPDIDLLAVDYLPESASLSQVKFDGVPDEAHPMVIGNMKAYQRIQAAGAGTADGIKLLQAGYGSATAMAGSSPSEIAERSGLNLAVAKSYHALAEGKATDAALAWIAHHDLERDLQVMRNGTLPQAPAYLAKLAGYADLFGTPNFCRCEHCQSVLGPAAYFVDLMYFVERHVLGPSFKAHGGEAHDLHLRSRRPDLWTLELTCDNTTRVVPTLDLVIDLLEAYIVRTKGLASSAELYERLATVDHSIKLPFSLPLEQLSLWLGHLDLDRSEIADTLLLSRSTADTRARISLRMSREQFDLIKKSRLGDRSASAVRAAEGFFILWLKANLNLSTIPGETETRRLDPIGVLMFSQAIDSAVETAEDILKTGFVTGDDPGIPSAVELEGGIATPGGVQNDTQVVKNLTAGRLDRFERFVRLWRHVPWTVAELDYVLGRLLGTGPLATGSQELDEGIVSALARLLSVQDRLRVSVEELCALCDELPSVPLRDEKSLFSRLFDPPLDQNLLIDSSSAVRARLAAALQINDEALTLLTDGLEPCLGGLSLDSRNLSLLFRYARLARLLKLSVDELLETVLLAESISSRAENERCILTLEDLEAVLEVHRWRVASGFTIPEIQLITGSTDLVPAGRDDPEELATRIVGEIASDRALHLSAELFTQIGLTEDEAVRMIADNHRPVGGNPPLLEPIPGTDAFRIRRNVEQDDVLSWFRFDPEPRAALVDTVAEEIFAIVRSGGQSGFEPDDLAELGLSATEAQDLIDENLSTATGDGKPFELVLNSISRYQLTSEGSEAEAVEAFGNTPANVESARAILTFRARELVTRNYPDVAKDVHAVVRHAGDDGFEPAAFTALALSASEADAFVTGNLAPAGPFEQVALPGAPVRYRRRADLSEAQAIASFGAVPGDTADFAATKSILRHRAVDLVARHLAVNVLAAKASTAANTTPERTRALLDLALPSEAAERETLVDALQGGPPQILSDVLAALMRYAVLFRSPAFDPQALAFVRANPAALALADPPTAETIRRVYLYVTLARAPDPAFEPGGPTADASALQAVLAWADRVATPQAGAADTQRLKDLASALKTDARQIEDALAQVVFPTDAPSDPADPQIDELVQVAHVLVLMQRLGPPAEILSLSVSEDYDDLARGADGVLAAIRAKYTDEEVLRQTLEPFEDMLRSRTRDGLVEYLLSAPDDATTDWRKRFADADDLYHHFLTDVMVGGCARTSKIVAATMSLQLYVQRVVMNLEHTRETPVFAARFDPAEAQAEWRWRKNYQVWVANRKVFLYPETYLEPGLRDDKTPFFRELEDTLLQQEISDSNVDDAYGRYLSGFEAVARLKIAGACYDEPLDTLHLFGATHNDPPIFYYRRIDDAKKAKPVASAWQPLALQIPTRYVSPVLFNERLYVFWLETTTRPVTTFADGNSDFTGYQHAVRIKYSMLRADKRWTPPHALRFSVGGAIEETRLILDPLLKLQKEQQDAYEAAKTRFDQQQSDQRRLVGELEGKDREARDAVGLAQALRDQPIDQTAEVVALGVIASAAFAGMLGLTFGNVILAGDAYRNAWLGSLALDAQTSVAELGAAGVAVGDGFTLARRKLALWRAQLLAQIAAQNLALAKHALALTDLILAGLSATVVPVRWDRSGRDHSAPIDNYTPYGWEWERVYPDVRVAKPDELRLVLVPTNESIPGKNDAGPGSNRFDSFAVDLFSGVLRPIAGDDGFEEKKRPNNANGRITLAGAPHKHFLGQEFFLASLFLHTAVIQGQELALGPPDATVQAVNGDPYSVIVEADGDPVWVRPGLRPPSSNIRLGTTLVPALTTAFDQQGASTLLTRGLQLGLTEKRSRITPVDEQDKEETRSPFYERNPFLTYFRETFLHIPFSIADHLNSQQRFAESQRWYHRIFDPTAVDGRPWRYREFQLLRPTTLRATLTNAAALRAYRTDPFNPHAIARLRPGAYEKAIVMKYIDNLLDWGDMLFARFTMESVNEAMMLYAMAADILGPRPVEVGPCGESSSPRTYESIAPSLRSADLNGKPTTDLLIEELELLTLGTGNADISTKFIVDKPPRHLPLAYTSLTSSASTAAYASTGEFAAIGSDGGEPAVGSAIALSSAEPFELGPEVAIFPEMGDDGYDVAGGRTWKATDGWPAVELYSGNPIGGADAPVLGGQVALTLGPSGDPVDPPGTVPFLDVGGLLDKRKVGLGNFLDAIEPSDFTLDIKYGLGDVEGRVQLDGKLPPEKLSTNFKPFELARARLVFCIPPNGELTGYWDRVEDRLNKIRNCMDIAGVRRRLELFSPEIDPRLLVRMRAAGLSLDDVMNVTSGNVPPYRFTYLIDKAKQHVSLVQSFGGQVLSALEKRDGEELTRLRTVHEQNLLKLRARSAQLEIDAAEDTIASLEAQRAAVLRRQEHYTSLSTAGLLASESKNQQLQQTAAGARTMAGITQVVASVLSIIPDLGAPTAMKFGGSQLGPATRSMAESFSAAAAFAEMGASMAGVEGSNRRRDQEWRHQAEMAKRELAQLEKQIDAAGIRRDIAIESQKIQERSLDQIEEIFDFLRDRFTSFGRFTWLSGALQKLHRMAFNDALSLARLAEQAYRFERPDETDKEGLTGNYWDAGNAGLLAGDRLMLDLHNLERRYTETNYRTLELEQSFSLARFDPDALSKLKTEVTCDFEIPEWFFDLTYAGHYRRRIKAVRLTIPCVVGPHTNVGATLRLTGSHTRMRPNAESPVPVPLRHVTAIAASMGQSDAGVFEFSFRDERYMPFEGAGANSRWQLTLPKVVKPFDYTTISDVILRISYTAEEDSELRTKVEAATGILEQLADHGIKRTLSLRNDFPAAWNALLAGAPNGTTTVDISEVCVPFFLSTFDLATTPFDLLVDKLPGEETYPTVTFETSATTDAGPDAESGLYRLGTTTSVAFLGEHTIGISDWGSVAAAGGLPDAPERLDASKIGDILLRAVLKRDTQGSG